jgi:hypothetical protein
MEKLVTFSTQYRAMQCSEASAYADKEDYIIVRNGRDFSVISRAGYDVHRHGPVHSISLYIENGLQRNEEGSWMDDIPTSTVTTLHVRNS